MKGRRVVWNEGLIRRRISKTGRVNITTKALATGRLFQTAAAVVCRPASWWWWEARWRRWDLLVGERRASLVWRTVQISAHAGTTRGMMSMMMMMLLRRRRRCSQ